MNCIWITIDSFRQDHIHCYRPEGTRDDTGSAIPVRTPAIDRLAAESVRFTRMRAEALPTIPCRRGFFTGQRVFPWQEEPTRKGMYITLPGWRPLREEDTTVAEHLAQHGYVNGLVADVYHLMKPSQNFHRGFHSFNWVRGQEYDQWNSQPLPEGYVQQFLKPGSPLEITRNTVLTQYLKNQFHRRGDDEFQAARTFSAAIEWLQRNAAHEQFFLYIDSFDPHEPFEAPQNLIDMYDPHWEGPKLIYGNPYRRQDLTDEEHYHLRARYAAACTLVDEWVGKLLATLETVGRKNDTLVVLVSDHGKIIGEFTHYGMPPQDTGLQLNQVPCLIRHPGREYAGAVCDHWLYNTDVTATVLDLLDVPPKPDVDGRSVWPAIEDCTPFRDHLVTAHGPMIAVWQDHWLYLINTEQETRALYDLEHDPFRRDDLSDSHPDLCRELAHHITRTCEFRS
mgnify:CR=1 FL=1